MNHHCDIPTKSALPARSSDSKADEEARRSGLERLTWVAALMLALTLAAAAWWHVHKQHPATGSAPSSGATEGQPAEVAKATSAEVSVVLNARGAVTAQAIVTVNTLDTGRLHSTLT